MKLIKNVSLASGNSFKKVNILFGEHIEQVSTGKIISDEIKEEFDYTGCIVMPGAVDMHTHILMGTDNDTSELSSKSAVAINGGYTTLADMSFLSKKPIFRDSDLEQYQKLIADSSHCDIALWGHTDFSQFPYHIDYINEVWAAGVIGFLIMHPSPNSIIENVTYDDVMDLFDTVYDTDISFAFQGYDDSSYSFQESRLTSIRKILRRLQDNPLHFIGIFDKDSLDVLNIAFRRSDLTYSFPVDELIKVVQRFNEDGLTKDAAFTEYVKLLFDSMKNGKLYCISTEAGAELKSVSEIDSAAFSGHPRSLLQWTVPWVLSELWKKKRVSLQSCIRILSENPAKRLGLFPNKGAIIKGSSADIVIIDPNTPIVADLTDIIGEKVELSCSVKATFLRGNLLNDITNKQKPIGQLVKRSNTTRRKSSSTCWT
jgi:dihydroorotase-like cyclic amidohydrolase